MLIVLMGLAYLYVGAVRSYISTYRQAQHHRTAITQLEHENARLRARRATLRRTGTLEHAARELGMVRPGERPYVIEGLPPG